LKIGQHIYGQGGEGGDSESKPEDEATEADFEEKKEDKK